MCVFGGVCPVYITLKQNKKQKKTIKPQKTKQKTDKILKIRRLAACLFYLTLSILICLYIKIHPKESNVFGNYCLWKCINKAAKLNKHRSKLLLLISYMLVTLCNDTDNNQTMYRTHQSCIDLISVLVFTNAY